MEQNYSKLDLQMLVNHLESQNLKKRDFIVPSQSLSMQSGRLIMSTKESDISNILLASGISPSGKLFDDIFDVMDNCHNQIADKLGIPQKYYDKLRIEAIDMLDYNVSEWLRRKQGNYFLRSFTNGDNGIARAFLSDRFKVIDHIDILFAALEAIKQTDKRVNIDTADLTDKKMYIRFTSPDIIRDAPALLKDYKLPDGNKGTGHGICTGFILSNSETGHGTFTVAPRITVLACQNGMIVQKDKIAERHLGSRMDVGTINWSEGTRQKEMLLINSQVQDAVRTYLSEEYLGRIIDEMTLNGTNQLEHPVEAVQNIGSSLNFSEERKSELLNYFVKSGDTTGFGAVQSLTYLAQNEQPDMRYELEAVSVDVLQNIKRFDTLNYN